MKGRADELQRGARRRHVLGDGDTTLDGLFGQLFADKDTPKWRFSRTNQTIKAGRDLHIHNEGGEFHTFTEVPAFGGGCIPPLNTPFGSTPVPECEPEVAPNVPLAFVTSGMPAGGELHIADLPRGVHRFEGLIHSWMRSTVTVR